MLKILCISLGCDKNLVDMERMLGLLGRDGFGFTDDEAEADAAIVNTCCFINDAKEESINTILELAQLKKSGRLRALLVTGCLAQRYQEEIIKEIPEVDGIIGTSSFDEISTVLKRVLSGETVSCFCDIDKTPSISGNRRLTTGGHYAFLKIAEGCDKHCTYCIIPSLRGRYRSVPMEELEEEARRLAEQGVRELILVAQETTLYGMDIYGRKMLPQLLCRLAKITDIRWLRLLYCYPEEINDELLEVIAEQKKVCHYLDLPIQHASDRILRRMGRKTSKEELRCRIRQIRSRIPDIALRTTLITGFPGETKKDQEELLRFVREMEFERLGVFAYSAEEGTPAASFLAQVPEKLRRARRAEVMELQQEIAFKKAESMRGKVLTAMIEGRAADEPVYVGRTYMDAPDVDGYVFVEGEGDFLSGDFVQVKVTGASGYDLIGEVYDESAE